MLNYPSDIYNQSAVIPFQIEKSGIKILLIKSRKGKWIIPKGIIENNFTAQESAHKEAIEEAGVDGIVYDELIGEYKYEKWDGTCHVKVYLMKVDKELESWEEDFFRIRKWFNPEKASRKINNPDLSEIIRKISGIINSRFELNDTARVVQ